METSSKRRLLTAWLALVAITIVYVGIDHSVDDQNALVASSVVTMSAILLALVKFRLIMSELMDVRHAPPLLRRLTDLLVAIIGVATLTTYLIGRAVA